MNTKKHDRTIDIFVRDSANAYLVGADIQWKIEGESFGTIENSDGRGRIGSLDDNDVVEVIVSYKGQVQTQTLAAGQDNFTFVYSNITLHPIKPTWGDHLKKHTPAMIGIVFILLATVLAFAFPNVTPLQHRIILVMVALGGGAFGTEISGMIKTDLTLGTKLTISATGAAAIFVILFFFVPAPTEPPAQAAPSNQPAVTTPAQ